VNSELVMDDGCGVYGRMGGAPSMSQGGSTYVPAGLVGREQSGATEREPHSGMHGQARSHAWSLASPECHPAGPLV
jgi:hypothetical protein